MTMTSFGADVVEPGRLKFRFWAPDCDSVSVEIEGRDVVMHRDGDGVFEVLTSGKPGDRYKYRVSPDLAVPDPASRRQSGDVHGHSVVVDPNYQWSQTEWRGRAWHETVVYEIHTGAFGGFSGIKSHLPRLAELGITAIELMPIADFAGQRNWGYDGVLPYAPDEAYGTPAQLKDLIDAAHGFKIQMFLDVVYNHFGPDGNYLSVYASSFFDPEIHTAWGNAINFKEPHVRRFFIENAIYWLTDYRFDGLRFDAVHAINDDEFLLEISAAIRNAIPDRHVHLILENENNDASLLRQAPSDQKFDAQWTDDWHHCLHVLLTGEREGYYEDFQNPAAQLARCLAEGFAYQGEPSPHANNKPRGTPSAHLPPSSFVICLQNHDQIGNRAMGERLTTLATSESLHAAIVLLLLTPQIPMLFMGEEWGETRPFLFFTDHHDELADAVRNGRRKEFAHFTAFTDPDKREKIPDPNARETFDASVPEFLDELSDGQIKTIEFYRRCLALRAKFLVPHLTGTRSISATAIGRTGVQAQWCMGDGKTLTVAANFGDMGMSFNGGTGPVLFSTTGDEPQRNELPPRSAFVWLAS
jgi:maltooligosyltrehalose trehalohydrolase